MYCIVRLCEVPRYELFHSTVMVTMNTSSLLWSDESIPRRIIAGIALSIHSAIPTVRMRIAYKSLCCFMACPTYITTINVMHLHSDYWHTIIRDRLMESFVSRYFKNWDIFWFITEIRADQHVITMTTAAYTWHISIDTTFFNILRAVTTKATQAWSNFHCKRHVCQCTSVFSPLNSLRGVLFYEEKGWDRTSEI